MMFFYHDDVMMPPHGLALGLGLTGENEKRKPRRNSFIFKGHYAAFRNSLPANRSRSG
jgi:hypothetical protein